MDNYKISCGLNFNDLSLTQNWFSNYLLFCILFVTSVAERAVSFRNVLGTISVLPRLRPISPLIGLRRACGLSRLAIPRWRFQPRGAFRAVSYRVGYYPAAVRRSCVDLAQSTDAKKPAEAGFVTRVTDLLLAAFAGS